MAREPLVSARSTVQKGLQLAIGLSVAALFLWLTVRKIEAREIRHALEAMDLGGIVAAVIALMIGYACRIERWRLMLLPANRNLRWSNCAGPLLASFAANNVLPFRIGDVIRSFAFNTTLGATSGVVLATVFVERLLDLLVLLGLFGAGIAAFDLDASRLAGFGCVVLLTAAAAVLLILLLPGVMTPLALAVARCAARWLPRFGDRIGCEVMKSLTTLRNLAGGGRMIVLIAWSAAAWLAEGCAFWLTALSFPSLSKPVAGWLALPVGALATLIPSTPGYVGTFDYFTRRVMVALGNDEVSATAYAFSIHAVVWLPPTVGGCLYLLLRLMRKKAEDRHGPEPVTRGASEKRPE